MELGVLYDDRNCAQDEEYPLELTPLGRELYNTLQPILNELNLSFPVQDDGIPTTRMQSSPANHNAAIKDYIAINQHARSMVLQVFLGMHAVQQMLAFLYHIARAATVSRQGIYEQFFDAPFVKRFCDQEGIETATIEASRRRCPFLLNILDACGIIRAERDTIHVQELVLLPYLVRPHTREEREESIRRLGAVVNAWPANSDLLEGEDLSIVRELFGPTFLTDSYHLTDLVVVKE